MGKTAGDYLCERLLEWDVSTIYGFPGDGINGILGVLRRYEDRLRFIQTRHEEMAAFMACGHAKYTGEVGVCLATGGPGAIHLLNGLYDAKLDHQPVVATVGQTCVIIPSDVQEMDAVEKQPHLTHTMHSGVGYWPGRVIPERHDLQAAADILNAGEKVAMLVGQGAFHATDEIIAVADTLGAGVAKALLGKAAVPDDVPFCTGSIGLLGTRPSWDMMQGADTLLMVGSSFPYSEFLPEEGKVKGVQIRYPMDLALVGDSKQTPAELLPLLHRKTDRSWQEGIVKGVEQWWRLMDHRAKPADIDRDGDRPRVRPQALFAELSRQLPDNTILSSDSGSAANWFARHVKIRRGMKASLSGNLATMVPGVPYAIAAKFALPDRVAVAMVGDRAMQMGGMAENLTAAKKGLPGAVAAVREFAQSTSRGGRR
jgi:pyruvate dehydrogenase (quinone)